jgi:hypothetical protein
MGRRRPNGDAVTRAEFLRGLRAMHDELLEMRTDLAARFEAMDERFLGLRDWVSLVVGRLQTRVGRRLEDTVAGALRLALGMRDITPDQVRLRQKLVDVDGRIGPRGREYEYDVLALNGEAYIFEVKSAPEIEDVLRFNDKAELAISILRPARPKKVLVTLDKDPAILAKARELGVVVV